MRTLLASMASLVNMILAIPVVIVCFPFWCVAALTRKLQPLFEKGSVTWREVIEFDPFFGWRPKPNLDVYCDCGFDAYHVKTDAQGYRGEGTLEDCDVIVFGDSFAFAHGVDDEKAFFATHHSKLKFKAIGAPGYNMVQEFMQIRRTSHLFKGKMVVWFVCIANDLHESVLPNMEQYRVPFMRKNDSGEWEVVNEHLKKDQWTFNPENVHRERERYAAIYGNNDLSARVYSACEFLIEQGQNVCVNAGAKLVLISLPMKAQLVDRKGWVKRVRRFPHYEHLDPSFPEKKLAEIAEKFQVPFVSGMEYFKVRDLIPFDGHLNERGNRRIAEKIEELYRDYCENKTFSVSSFDAKKIQETGVRASRLVSPVKG